MHPLAIKIPAVIMAVGASIVGTAAIVTYDAGAVRVSVVEKKSHGTNVHVIVPAVLVPVALDFVPSHHLHLQAEETRKWLPAVKAALRELDRCPDATLVQVTSPGENVNISKRGNSLYIDVDDPGETVHVSFPVPVVQAVVQKLEESNPGPPV
ncbi:MAG: hypothetical protein ACYDA9_09440 [Terriglobia bacterium]